MYHIVGDPSWGIDMPHTYMPQKRQKNSVGSTSPVLATWFWVNWSKHTGDEKNTKKWCGGLWRASWRLGGDHMFCRLRKAQQKSSRLQTPRKTPRKTPQSASMAANSAMKALRRRRETVRLIQIRFTCHQLSMFGQFGLYKFMQKDAGTKWESWMVMVLVPCLYELFSDFTRSISTRLKNESKQSFQDDGHYIYTV